MQTTKQMERDAKKLLRLCLVNGSLDETRVRQVVDRVIASGRSGGLGVLARFQRLVRLDRARHTADVDSAAPLPAEVRAAIETAIGRMLGPAVTTTFAENPALIGGVRVKVGSDVYDGSIRGHLAAIESRF
jgi:F-type H+-transporting ATPase subunit delta